MSEKLTYSVGEAARLLGISRNSAFAAVKSGEIPSVKIGHRRLVPVAALNRMLTDVAGGPATVTVKEPSDVHEAA